MSDDEVAPLETAFGVDHHVTARSAPERPAQEGGPDMVQLLTPEGERVPPTTTRRRRPHRRGSAQLLPRPRPRPPLRRRGHALQRQGELGLWASRSARRPPRSARAARCAPTTTSSRPTASTASPGAAASTRSSSCMFRGVNHGGWDPQENNFHLYTIVIGAQTLHATGYAMGVQRDGDVGTGDDERDTAVIAYFGDGATSPGRRQRGLRLRRRSYEPCRLLLPEQPVGHLRARREADPQPAVPAGPRLRLPRRARRRQRHPRDVRRHQQASTRPARPRPHLHRGVHLPDGRPHHVRRPDEVPRLGRGRGVEARDPIVRLKRWLTHEGMADETSSRPSTTRPTARRPRCASAA